MAVKVTSLLVGTLCLFLGYRLLMRGIYPDANQKAVWDDNALLIKRGAPGAIFALFGASIIVVSLLQSAEARRREAPSPVEQAQAQPTQSSSPLASPQQRKPKDVRQAEDRPRGPAQRKTAREERASPGATVKRRPPATAKEREVLAKPGRA
jgi:hypothetical protein